MNTINIKMKHKKIVQVSREKKNEYQVIISK